MSLLNRRILMIDLSVPIWFMFLLGGLAGYLLCFLIMELRYRNDKIKQIKRIIDLKNDLNKKK